MKEREPDIDLGSASMRGAGDDDTHDSSKPQENLGHDMDNHEENSFESQQSESQLSDEMNKSENEPTNGDAHRTSSKDKENFHDHPSDSGDHCDITANTLSHASPNASHSSMHVSSLSNNDALHDNPSNPAPNA